MNHKYNNETLAAIMKAAADDAGFQNRCEEISKDFKEIDYLKENFERNEVKS